MRLESTTLRRLRTLASQAVLVVAAGFLILRLAQDWTQVAPSLQRIQWGYVIAALVPTLGTLVATSWGWTWAMRWAGIPLSGWKGFSLYYRSSIFRYLPGSFWYIAGRAYLCQQESIPLSVFATSALVELFYLLAIGGSLGGGVGLLRSEFVFLLGMSAVCFLALVIMTIFPRLFALPQKFRRQMSMPLNPNRAILLYLWAIYLVAWLLYGLAFYWVLLSVVGPARIPIFYALTVNTASWGVGFVSLVPTGLGVREAALSFLFQPYVPAHDVIIASLLHRIVEVSVEGCLWQFALRIKGDSP